MYTQLAPLLSLKQEGGNTWALAHGADVSAGAPGGHVSMNTYFPALSAGRAGKPGHTSAQILVSNTILHYKAWGSLEKGLIQGRAGNVWGSQERLIVPRGSYWSENDGM